MKGAGAYFYKKEKADFSAVLKPQLILMLKGWYKTDDMLFLAFKTFPQLL